MFSELQTVCFEAANLVNERPIGVHPTELGDDVYPSPNHLMLGRSSTRVPSGPFKQTRDPRLRLEFVQKLIDMFWKRWNRDYFQSLLIRQKWHVEKRNVKVGDVALIQDSNAVRGQWKMGSGTQAFPGDDERVRKDEVQYKCFPPDDKSKENEGNSYTVIQRPVQRFVVILPVEESGTMK